MTYIIGDVHGHYKTLLKLVDEFPKNSDLIFVGDLVDRGKYSKEVIEFVRKNGYRCVLGNHEELMIFAGNDFICKYKPGLDITYMHEMWMRNGGKETLYSYELIEVIDNRIVFKDYKKGLEQLKEDIKWLETLPLYIELENKKDDKSIVISHSNIGDVWHHHNNPKGQETFKEYALWNRKESRDDCEVFNIFGHTPIEKVDTEKHFINIDTGCYINDVAYAKLSAYCIDNGEVISTRRV